MSTNDTTSQFGPPSGPQPGASAARLTRSRDDRVIAGVCGGLGRYARVDPVIFRIVLVVLAFFGGVGLLLYLVGWLFLAEDGDTASPIESLFGRGRSSTNAAIAVLLLILAIAAFGFGVWGNHLALLALVVIAGVLLVRHTTGAAESGQAGRPQSAAPPAGGATTAASAAPGTTTTSAPYAPHGPYGGPPYGEQPYGEQPYGPYEQTSAFPAAAVPAAPAPRERSVLGRIVLSIAALVAAGLIAAGLAGAATIPAEVIVASALTVVAIGLLVGTVYGRARWLVVVALGLSLALAGLTASRHVGDRIDAVTANRTWTPTSVAALQPAYNVGAGSARLDLRQVNFAGQHKQVTVHVGVGAVTVLVPPTVDVTARSNVGVGQVQIFGHRPVSGAGSRSTVTDYGTDGPGGGRLILSADAGMGDINVVRR